MKKKLTRWALITLVVLSGLFGAASLWLHQSRPEGEPSAAADTRAEEMLAAVNDRAWQRTGAVSFTFRGSNKHIWDRARDLSSVTWGGCRVLQHLSQRRGRVWCDGGEVTDSETRKQKLDDAYAHWVNDTFWLHAPNKAFDRGTTRAIPKGRKKQLLVSYASGGVTPGDAYLWELDSHHRPKAWRMWVSIIPIGGLRATWEGWQQLSSGAWVSTRHRIGPLELALSDVRGARTLEELVGPTDPFAEIEHGD